MHMRRQPDPVAPKTSDSRNDNTEQIGYSKAKSAEVFELW